MHISYFNSFKSEIFLFLVIFRIFLSWWCPSTLSDVTVMRWTRGHRQYYRGRHGLYYEKQDIAAHTTKYWEHLFSLNVLQYRISFFTKLLLEAVQVFTWSLASDYELSFIIGVLSKVLEHFPLKIITKSLFLLNFRRFLTIVSQIVWVWTGQVELQQCIFCQ